ncbi:MAG: hypothetical protein IJH39_10845 [Clostridia bacterium]|nr:hypothetical protein [Clostridia bacterium]
MKVLFAVSNEEISNAIVKKYQKVYKEIISYKNVYYFNAILKEIQKDKSYDRIVISEDLEIFPNNQFSQIDKIIFDKLDSISDEASNFRGEDIPIILICSDRRTKSEQMLIKLFGISIYNAVIGNDRSIDEVCRLINKPRSKKEAKTYYKIDVEDVNYQSENENGVSEVEIQNILAHYKKLGKNEEQYIRSFDNIASQYTDVQLKVICKFLPLNVRAVLEERSPKYQQVMAFSQSAINEIKDKKEKSGGISKQLLKTENNAISNFSNPVVVPSEVNFGNVKKLTRPKPRKQVESMPQYPPVNQTRQVQSIIKNGPAFEENIIEEPIINTPRVRPVPTVNSQRKENENITNNQVIESLPMLENEPIMEEPKRGRGRPRKNPIPEQVENVEPKRRGRPRKNPLPEENGNTRTLEPLEDILPGFKNNNYIPPKSDLIEESSIIPGFDDNDKEKMDNINNESVMPGFSDDFFDEILPDPIDDNEINQEEQNEFEPITDKKTTQQYETMKKNTEENTIMPGFDFYDQKYDEQQYGNQQYNNQQYNEQQYNNQQYDNQQFNFNNKAINSNIDISTLLTPDKKVVSFVGTSKNGTSFIVNNLAAYTSANGIKTAILDTTKNRNSYYIYTRNEEQLRKNAVDSINNLVNGIANGIEENPNLTIYTAMPNDHVDIQNSGAILKTLVQNYSLVLIDCDFETPADYFRQSQETYLVQSLDILTIQPLTAFLRELETQNALEKDRIRIILNKCVNIRGVNEKIIIGGMSCYNDPSMSFNIDLFDRDTVKYLTIPFEEDVYTKYLEAIINCNISIRGYSKSFMQVLKDLKKMVYPSSSSSSKSNSKYQPPKPSYNSRYKK